MFYATEVLHMLCYMLSLYKIQRTQPMKAANDSLRLRMTTGTPPQQLTDLAVERGAVAAARDATSGLR